MTRTTAIILAVIALAALAAPTADASSESEGGELVPGSTVPPCEVPALRYSTLKEVKTRGIDGSGCVLGRVTKRYPKRRHGRGRLKRCRRGTKLLVSRQTPRGGTLLPYGSKVNITLTCGKLPPALRQQPG